jgi:DNA polymerase-3 subunit alpha
LAGFISSRIGELEASGVEYSFGIRQRDRQTVVVAGLVTSIRIRNAQAGRIAFITLDDQSGRIEAGVFADDYREYANLINKDKILVVEGSLGVDDFTGNPRLRARRLWDIAGARAHFAKRIDVKVSARFSLDGLIESLMDTLSPFREGNRCPVRINYCNDQARVNLVLDQDWQVQPSDQLLQRLKGLEAVEDAQVVYT